MNVLSYKLLFANLLEVTDYQEIYFIFSVYNCWNAHWDSKAMMIHSQYPKLLVAFDCKHEVITTNTCD